MKFIYKSGILFLTFLVLLASGAKAQVNLSKVNLAYKYDRSAPMQLKHKVAMANDSAYIFLKITTAIGSLEDYKVDYAIKNGYDDGAALFVDSLAVSQHLVARDGNHHYLEFRLPVSAENQLMLMGLTTGQGDTYYFDVPLQGEKDFPKTSLMVMESSRNLPIFNDYIHEQDSFRIVSFHENTDEAHVFYYGREFTPAAPPMATSSGPVEKQMEIDSIFTVSAGDKIAFPQWGLYFIQEDSSSLEGISIRIMDNYYPQMARVENITDPLIYISTAKEIGKLKDAEEVKKAMDRYWLEMTNSPERAKNIIRDYFKQVEQANALFTNYKEGWKNDQGMILMVFGTPDEVYMDENAEEWIYNKTAMMSRIRFTFAKVKNIFTNQHFNLIRNRNYDNEWFRMVDLWRKGRQDI